MASSGAAPRPTAQQRTIGEILLAHGYVEQDQLDRAVERQRETGFPLGQILVEAGAITRLELASALAVQWSDMPIAVRPEDGDRRSALPAADGAERKARVAPAGDPAWQEELSTTLRALAARLEHVEASLAGLVDGDDPDEAAELRQAIEDLQARGESHEALLAETTRRSASSLTPEDLEERLGTVAAALETALSRADEVELRIAPLATRVDSAAADAAHAAAELERRSAQVTEIVDALGQRIEERAAATLGEMRAAVAALSDRPSVDPALAARVEELAVRLEALESWPAEDQTLTARVDELARRVTILPSVDQLEELDRVVAALAERPSSDPVLAARVDELAEQVSGRDELALLEALRRRVDELAARPMGDPDLGARVAAFAARLDSVPDAGAVEALKREVASLKEAEPVGPAAIDELAERLTALEQAGAYDELRARVTELAARPGEDPLLRQRLHEIETRLGAIADGGAGASEAESVEALSRELAEATQSWTVERVALERRLSELAARLEQAGEASLPATALPPATTVPGTPAAEGTAADDLNRLWFAVERISLQLTEQHRDIDMLLARNDEDGRLDELVARLEDLEDRAWGAADTSVDDDAELAANGGGASTRTVARKLAELEKVAKSEREKLLGQIEQMLGSLEWRLQRLESASSTAPPLGS